MPLFSSYNDRSPTGFEIKDKYDIQQFYSIKLLKYFT